MTADTRILGAPGPLVGQPLRAGTVKNGPAFVADLPESFAGYTLIRAIGQGGMGCVYEARHNTLGKHFALKLLSDSLRDNLEAIDRFHCETLALGKLDHPNIVMASDAGVWQGRPFLVTELLQGQDLSSRVAEIGKLDTESVIAIAAQLSDALLCAHEHGYFHRDIKPSNVFYQSDGIAKLLDFGLVRSESNHSLTQAGCLMGTVDFVAPEQACNASRADAASDIYSLGCTLIYLLSGDVPYPDGRYPSLTAKLHAHLHDTPCWLEQSNREHPVWLIDLIKAMVAKSPSERPASCRIIHNSLKHRNFTGNDLEPASGIASMTTSEPTARKRSSTLGLKATMGAGLVLVVAGGIWAIGTRSVHEESLRVPTATSQMRATQTDSSSEFTRSNSSLVASSSATESEERTLPVSVTHNARGTSLPGFKSGKSTTEPSVFLSKDKSHE